MIRLTLYTVEQGFIMIPLEVRYVLCNCYPLYVTWKSSFRLTDLRVFTSFQKCVIFKQILSHVQCTQCLPFFAYIPQCIFMLSVHFLFMFQPRSLSGPPSYYPGPMGFIGSSMMTSNKLVPPGTLAQDITCITSLCPSS